MAPDVTRHGAATSFTDLMKTDVVLRSRVRLNCVRLLSTGKVSEQKGKGKSGPKGKDKGKKGLGKSKKDDDWPKAWARRDPKGKIYCGNHFVRHSCAENCGKVTCLPNHQGGWIHLQQSDTWTGGVPKQAVTRGSHG